MVPQEIHARHAVDFSSSGHVCKIYPIVKPELNKRFLYRHNHHRLQHSIHSEESKTKAPSFQNHFSISNIDRREKKSGAFPSSPYQISLFRLMVFKQHENYRLLILKMSFSYNILPKLIFDTAIHTLIIISAKTFMLKWQTKEALCK